LEIHMCLTTDREELGQEAVGSEEEMGWVEEGMG